MLSAPFLLSLLFVSSCQDAPASLPATNAQQQIEWEHIRTWSGRGSQYLDSFPSEGSMRVEWQTKQTPGDKTPGTLRIVFHSAISGRPLAPPTVDHQGEGTGMAYFSEEPRVFFIAVTSEGVEWTIRLSERVR
jgi:hypothetical protein